MQPLPSAGKVIPLRTRPTLAIGVVIAAVLLGIYLWVGVIGPAFETHRFRAEVIPQLKVFTPDRSPIDANEHLIRLADGSWLVLRYGESSVGAWSLTIVRDSAGQWYESPRRLNHFTKFTPQPGPDGTIADELLPIESAPNLPAVRNDLAALDFKPMSPP